MKQVILFLKGAFAVLGVWVLLRLTYLFFRTLRDARLYSAYSYYDPTAFVLVGLILLPPFLFVLHRLLQYVRKWRSGE